MSIARLGLLETSIKAGPPAKIMFDVALIGFEEEQRRTMTAALEKYQVRFTHTYREYPEFQDIPKITDSDCDLVIVDLDRDPDSGIDLVETICGRSSITVMAFSTRRDPALIMQCMRAGAREFLNAPVSAEVLGQAMSRALGRKREVEKQKKLQGKVILFCGAKGGSGVSTLASNFALALRQESGASVAVVDLKGQLGDVASLLGLTPKLTLADALRDAGHLDQEFLSSLLTTHSSGLSVLGSPDRCATPSPDTNGSLRKVLQLMREEFSYVVVDGGSTFNANLDAARETADSIYLVMQAEVPALRNAKRLMEHIQSPEAGKTLELVLNRYDSREAEIDESRVAKVLATPLNWKMPNDYTSVSRAVNSGIPVVQENSLLSKVLRQMARQACGKPLEEASKGKWNLFG